MNTTNKILFQIRAAVTMGALSADQATNWKDLDHESFFRVLELMYPNKGKHNFNITDTLEDRIKREKFE